MFWIKVQSSFFLYVSQSIAIFFLVCCDHVLCNKEGECAQSYCVTEFGVLNKELDPSDVYNEVHIFNVMYIDFNYFLNVN